MMSAHTSVNSESSSAVELRGNKENGSQHPGKPDAEEMPGNNQRNDNEMNPSDANDAETVLKTKEYVTLVTDAELAERVAKANHATDVLKECYSFETHRTNAKVMSSASTLLDAYYQFSDVSLEKAVACRREIASHMVVMRLVPILCEMVVDYITTTAWLDQEGMRDKLAYFTFYNSFASLFNYSDSSRAISSAAARVPGFFEFLVEKLKFYHAIYMGEAGLTEEEDDVVRMSLGFTHNCSADLTARTRMREVGFTAILEPYLRAKKENYQMSAILSLANIVNEEESDLINTSVEAVRCLLESLKKAVVEPMRRYSGFSAKELALGVRRLATNDSNKKMLVNEGALPLLLQLSKISQGAEERNEAVLALWALAFDDENKKKMILEPGLIAELKALSKSSDNGVRKSSQGVLWTLRYVLKKLPESEELAQTFSRTEKVKVADVTRSTTPHVMVSYQWDNQEVLISVADALKAKGYRIWMDVKDMTGSTLQAMAEAVEKSAVVLLCMSQRYKESPNCRAEAEYAFQRRVPIVPLLMETGFKPDGWLGILLGTKLYFNFSGRCNIEAKMIELVKELADRGRSERHGGTPDKFVSSTQPGSAGVVIPGEIVPEVAWTVSSELFLPTEKALVENWETRRVQEWIENNEFRSSALQTLTGKQLAFLKRLKSEAPEYFYNVLETKLELRNLEDVMRFVEALCRLKSNTS